MKIQEVNSMFRDVFNKLIIEEKLKKRHMCSLILGTQCEPQFDGFMNGRDFGIKPLEKIADGLGYDIEIVFKKKEIKTNEITEEEKNKYNEIEVLNRNFISSSIEKIIKNINNPDFIKSNLNVVPGAIQDVADNLFASIMNS